MWAILAIAGALTILTGWLPGSQAHEVALTRAGPVLGFLVAVTILAELADRAGVFDAAAGVVARMARGSTVRLFLLMAALATVTTIGLNLDTAAVLLTPVVLSLTAKLGLRPLPFALLVVWLANTASLLLPVSNLTNLLAADRLGLSALSFAGRMALPELAAVIITVGYLALLYRRDLAVPHASFPVAAPADRVTFWTATAACVALAPGVLLGVRPWIVACICAAITVSAFVIRDRRHLTFSLVPWRIVLFVEGLFLLIAAISRHGGTRLLTHIVGHSELATTATAAVTSNAVNNLPAYLAIEPAVPADNTPRLLAALIGTNTGPMVLLWGSLATLLWRDRCRARGVHVSAWTFALVGLGGVPLVLLGSWAALQIPG